MTSRSVLSLVAAATALVLVAVTSYLVTGALVAPRTTVVPVAVTLPAEAGAPAPVAVTTGAGAGTAAPLGIALIAWGAVLVLGAARWAGRDA